MTRKDTDTTDTKVPDPVRNPLLAALGAGDLAAKAVREAVGKAKERAEHTPELRPSELRKLIEEYTDAAVKLYQKLADQGEDTLGKLKSQPQVKKAISQLEEAIETAQDRVGEVAGDARVLAEDVLSRVTGKTRQAGEKAAATTEKLTDDVAEKLLEAGEEAATEIRATTQKLATKTTPAPKPVATTTPRDPAPKTTS